MDFELENGSTTINNYNLGGITEILLLDIKDFITYLFQDDDLYDVTYVKAIGKLKPFIELCRVNESNLTQTISDEIYTQVLNTFVHTLSSAQNSILLKASQTKFVVFVKTTQGQYLTFGSDGGVKITYSAQSDQMNGVNGYSITFEKKSIYPIFEVDPDAMKTKVLGTESDLYIITENSDKQSINYLIEIP